MPSLSDASYMPSLPVQRQPKGNGLTPRTLARQRPTVVIAAIVEREGLILLTQRLPRSHLAGYWEFPGGKLEPGENHRLCLEREMLEELDAPVQVGPLVHSTRFAYPDRTVELYFYDCTLTGEPAPLLGQQIRWVARTELEGLQVPPADNEVVQLLANS